MARRVEEITRVIGHSNALDPKAVVHDSNVAHWQELLQHFRYYRPDGWHPDTSIVGRELVEEGLAAGSGVILWVSDFIFSDLLTKIAFSRAGYAVSHLSRPTHGFSNTRFGIKFLNPAQTSIEDRFLHERIRITDDDTAGPLQALKARLKENGVVSIRVGAQGRRLARPRLLAGRLRLATGPAHLALTTGAVLLPVFTVMDGTWSYRTQIGSALRAPGSQGADYYEEIARQFVAQLEPIVLKHPESWKSWSLVDIA